MPKRKRKQKKLVYALLSLLLIVLLAVSVYVAYTFILPLFSSSLSSGSGNEGSSSSSSLNTSTNSTSSSTGAEDGFTPISFHFLDLNTQYTGDCTYIKAGDYDILIDAGARKGSGAVICEYLNQYVPDKKLELVIATHAHQDHIAGFVGNQDDSLPNGRTGVFYNFAVDTLIQFPLTDASTQIYKDYLEAVNFLKERGTEVYTALDCVKENNGAKRIFNFGEGTSMEVLYNYFYDHDRTDFKKDYPEVGGSFSEENDYSISVLFHQGKKSMLFTGDSEAWSEHSLVKENNLPANVVLYKGGHHGSYTATGEELLKATSPDAIVFECTAGTKEYASDPNHSFPAQETIDRIAPYTDRVYVTQEGSWEDSRFYRPMNGTVVVEYDEVGKETWKFSNNSLKLKDTEWFKNNRQMPLAWQSA